MLSSERDGISPCLCIASTTTRDSRLSMKTAIKVNYSVGLFRLEKLSSYLRNKKYYYKMEASCLMGHYLLKILQ